MNVLTTFTESQRFDQKWLWVIISLAILAPILISIFYKEGVIISVITCVPVVLILLSMRLKTNIDESGISIKFFPIFLMDKTIPWERVAQITVRKYKPIAEYGGWGIRTSYKNGMAYNVKGHWGIQLVLKDGKKILIGTQQHEQAEAIVQYYKKNTLQAS